MKRKKWIIVVVSLFFVLGVVFLWSRMFGETKKEYKEFSAFVAVPGDEIRHENRIAEKIAGISGARVTIEWLEGQSSEEKISTLITTGEYPDFIHGSDATNLLVEAGALLPLEEYLDDYPNLKSYLTDAQWESLRKEDGHIYFLPVFGVIQGKETLTMPAGEAFWIQKRVLEWAGYPTITTLDGYFDLITAYLEANPKTDGENTIGFEILCEDWRYFCLENPPMFLAGYPNDGCAIVDIDTKQAALYDTIPQAKQYYGKLCEMYQKGVIDPETFTLSYEQYLERISGGAVLGFVDQYWQFMSAQNSLYAYGKEDKTYVPLAITANEEIVPNYYCQDMNLNTGGGLGISVNCQDVEGALAFLDALLTPEVMILRHWGEEGIDYEVDENGIFYRTEEQRTVRNNGEWLANNMCNYGYFPTYEGMLSDGLNTVEPSDQPGEYYAKLSEYDKKFLDAYGFKTWTEFLGEQTKGEAWYPLYSCQEDWAPDTKHGKALDAMDRVKRLWLPKIIMSPEADFESNWAEYMETYQKEVDVDAYLSELNREIERRIENAK